MKKLIPICAFLLAIVAGTTQKAAAQTITTPVTQTFFTAKVNQLDALIGAGDIASANTKFDSLNQWMQSVLHVTKMSIHSAPDSTTRATYMNLITTTQIPLYQAIIKMKSDLVTNRSTLHTKLGQFNNTIY